MDSKNEVIILRIIKYAPPLFIITLSIFISLSLYLNNKKTFDTEKILIEKEHILNNKKLIKNQVDNVYEYIKYQQKNTESKLRKNLKEKVYEAYSIAMNIYKENKHLDKKTVEKMIKDALRTIRFNNGRGYFFIYSLDYECVLLPIAQHIEGKSFYNFKDGKGSYLTRNIISMIKKENEGFMKWWYHKPSDMNNQYEKLGFNKYFEPFNWFIGTGEYIEDFENDIKKDVLSHIQNLKYPNYGYIFTIDYYGINLTHIEKNILGLTVNEANVTTNNQKIYDAIKKTKKEGSTFTSYVQRIKPGSNLPEKKTSYLKNIQNWEWIIGKGFYEDEIDLIIQKKKKILDQRLKEDLNQLIISAMILTILLLLISAFISRLLERRFFDYKNEIKLNLDELTKQQNILAQQSKMAALGEMIANIAHQWRQPLSMISTVSTGMKLKRELGELDDKEFNQNLDYINNSTQYLSKTIDDFRNFFSTDKEEKEFKIKNAFENALDIIGVQYKNKNISIIKNIADISILGIKSELIQVFINILNNSRDELIKKEDENRLIFVDIYLQGNDVYIKIKDNAGGIDEKIIEEVFKPYFTTKSKNKGTGIGLYMSKEIINKKFKGEIKIENCEYLYNNKKNKGLLTIIKFKVI